MSSPSGVVNRSIYIWFFARPFDLTHVSRASNKLDRLWERKTPKENETR